MDKGAIKNFAVEARKILIKSAVTEAGLYGVTKDGCSEPIQKGNDFEVYKTIAGTENRIYGNTIKKRANLVKEIKKHGFEQVMEETSYTWFNRLIAIRFMEVNDYLPTRVRVLSAEVKGKREPDIVTQFLDVDLNMTSEELANVQKAKEENRYDDAFRMLFIKQCNELNDILPGLFEETDDYMELLLRLSYTTDGIVRMLIDTVPEENFDVESEGQVEIIGWMYQYYNTDSFNQVYDGNMSRTKVSKELLPSATQLFTPDWVVKQMCENTLIPLLYKDDEDRREYKYLVEDDLNIQNCIEIENIKILDPSMGSGHFLVYIFDILFKVYIKKGYSERQAVALILENNIYGLDIDKRAFQLSYFSLAMKARNYNRRIFRDGFKINVCYFRSVSDDMINICKTFELIDEKSRKDLINLFESYKNADEIGSIIKKIGISAERLEQIYMDVEQLETDDIIIYAQKTNVLNMIKMLLPQHIIMSGCYDAIVTNPPYLGSSRMSPILFNYVVENYADAKADLSMAFYEKAFNDFLKQGGIIGFLTTNSWMYLTTYDKFRKKMVENMTFILLVEFGTELFEGKIGHLPIVSWCCIKSSERIRMKSIRLVDYCYKERVRKQQEYFSDSNWYRIDQKKFLELPSYPIAYWLHDDFYNFMENKEYFIDDLAVKKAGIVTGNDNYFIRYWYEVIHDDIGFNEKEFNDGNGKKYNVIAKGGSNRQYYGNYEYVIKLQDLWNPEKTNVSVRRGEKAFYLKRAIGWSQIGNTQKTFREIDGAVCGTATPTIYVSDNKLHNYVLAFLNSCISKQYLDVFNPTLNLMSSDICNLPIRVNYDYIEPINKIVNELVEIYKRDWDSDERSWDFKCHPYIQYRNTSSLKTIGAIIQKNKENIKNRVIQFQNELDMIFSNICSIDISKLNNQKELNLREYSLKDDIISLIQYSVGCILGRYSLNCEGIICSNKDINYSDYEEIIPDEDNIIPITDTDMFEDELANKFIGFISKVFGEECLDDNLNYIVEVLEIKCNSVMDGIRSYFVKDFYKNHCKLYQKCPIYWLFDSGKQNGFKALIYMHRYDKDTVGRIRTNYLHKTQNAIENALNNAEYIMATSSSSVDRAKATKDRDKYIKQLSETRIYDQALAHVALQRIEIDLDDGVKHNYELFQGVEVSSEGSKKQSVDLLAKL